MTPILVFKIFVVVYTFIVYNRYFGWHLSAQSDAEIICDLLHLFMAIVLFLPEIWKMSLED